MSSDPQPDILPDTSNPVGAPPRVPYTKIISLKLKGLTYDEIASICKCTPQAIHARLRGFEPSIDNLKEIREHAVTQYEVLKDVIINSLSWEDIKRTSPMHRMAMVGICEDKILQIQGKDKPQINLYIDASTSLQAIVVQERELIRESGMGELINVTSENSLYVNSAKIDENASIEELEAQLAALKGKDE